MDRIDRLTTFDPDRLAGAPDEPEPADLWGEGSGPLGQIPVRYKALTRSNIASTPLWRRLPHELRESIQVVSAVLPFRVNEYVTDELIDWDRVPDDPIYQLTFPQRGMLEEDHYRAVADLLRRRAPADELRRTVDEIRLELNPHPAGQLTHNVPKLDGESLTGLQHKYRETVLFFASSGQTCHAYCTFCFRWPQFVGMKGLKFAAKEAGVLVRYLQRHREVSDVIFTGGDPMTMRTAVFERYVTPLLESGLDHLSTIRIGTKAVAYWPQRFVTDPDADDLLRLYERVIASGRNLAVMGHFSHPRELSTPVAQEAIRRIRATGAKIYMQSPVIRHVNDDSDAWSELWRTGVRLGCTPYYMFVERDTGPKQYFELPLWRAWRIFRNAHSRVSGLSRTVRGPVMSAFGGKVQVLGARHVMGEPVFVLRYLQARDPVLVDRPFFAKFDGKATWFSQLEPLGKEDRHFFRFHPERMKRELPLAADHTLAAG